MIVEGTVRRIIKHRDGTVTVEVDVPKLGQVAKAKRWEASRVLVGLKQDDRVVIEVEYREIRVGRDLLVPYYRIVRFTDEVVEEVDWLSDWMRESFGFIPALYPEEVM